MSIKQIPRPVLKSATQLSALDMNKIHFDKKHTVLTPQVLESISTTASKPQI